MKVVEVKGDVTGFYVLHGTMIVVVLALTMSQDDDDDDDDEQ